MSTAIVIEHPASQGGFLVELRHIRNPLVGYGLNYGFNRANEEYSSAAPDCTTTSPEFCVTSAASVPADAHELTADWVASLKVLALRPFVLAGGGVLVNVPKGGMQYTTTCDTLHALCEMTSTNATTRTEVKALFNYGAGVDWAVAPHLGLRFQYRGRVNKAPDLATAFSSTGAFQHTAEPVLGAFLRF